MKPASLRSVAGCLATMLALAPSVLTAEGTKDPLPPRARPGLAWRSAGGPDAFGYTFADSAEGSCTAGGFLDISASGAFVVDGDDTASGPVTLGAPFDFYGTSLASLVMASNGYLSTDPADLGTDWSNDCPLPAPLSSGGGARIYPLHDDLDLEPGIGRGLYQFFPLCPRASGRCLFNEPCSVFQWHRVAHYPGGGPRWDFEVILYHDSNDLVSLIGPGNPERGSGSTTGIQGFPPPSTGLAYACNGFGSLPDDATVCFFHPDPVPDRCSAADLEVEVETAAAEVLPPGPGLEILLTATNRGPGPGRNVVVTSELPPEVSWLADDCGAGPPAEAPGGAALTWNVGSLATGASATCRLTARLPVAEVSAVESVASVTADGTDPDPDNNSATAVFGLQQEAPDIPTLSGLGLALMALLLGAAAAYRLRR